MDRRDFAEQKIFFKAPHLNPTTGDFVFVFSFVVLQKTELG